MTEQFPWAALDCGSSACRSPERARSGQRTNGGCRCHPEDVARAHERIAAQLRGTPSHAFEMREDARTIQMLRGQVRELEEQIANLAAIACGGVMNRTPLTGDAARVGEALRKADRLLRGGA